MSATAQITRDSTRVNGVNVTALRRRWAVCGSVPIDPTVETY